MDFLFDTNFHDYIPRNTALARGSTTANTANSIVSQQEHYDSLVIDGNAPNGNQFVPTSSPALGHSSIGSGITNSLSNTSDHHMLINNSDPTSSHEGFMGAGRDATSALTSPHSNREATPKSNVNSNFISDDIKNLASGLTPEESMVASVMALMASGGDSSSSDSRPSSGRSQRERRKPKRFAEDEEEASDNVLINKTPSSPFKQPLDAKANGETPKRTLTPKSSTVNRSTPPSAPPPEVSQVAKGNGIANSDVDMHDSDSDNPLQVDEGNNNNIEEEDEEEEEEEEEQDDDDDEWDSDDDPEKLWCICRKPDDNKFMIACDSCEDWFHSACVKVTSKDAKELEEEGKEWYCPDCRRGLAIGRTKEEMKKQVEAKQKKEAAQARAQRDKKRREREEKRKKQQQSSKNRKKPPASVNNRKSSPARKSSKEPVQPSKRRSSTSDKKSNSQNALKAKEETERLRQLMKAKKESLLEKFKKKSLSSDQEGLSSKSPNAEPASNVNATPKPSSESSSPPMKKKKKDISDPTALDLFKPDISFSKKPDQSGSSPKVGQSSPAIGSTGSKPPLPTTITCNGPNCSKKLGTNPTGQSKSKTPALYCSDRCIKDYVKLVLPQVKEWREKKGKGECDPNRIAVIFLIPSTKKSAKKEVSETTAFEFLKQNPFYEICVPNASNLKRKDSEMFDSKPATAASSDQNLHNSSNKSLRSPTKAHPENSSTASSSLLGAGKGRRDSQASSSSAQPQAKRRKSSSISESGSSAAGGDASKQSTNQQFNVEEWRESVRKQIREGLMTRSKRDGGDSPAKSTESDAERLASQIEEELFKIYNKDARNPKYKSKARSLIFNIKDPKNVLFKKIMAGEIPPEQLVRMESTDLAPSELAKWREQESKHSLEMLKREAVLVSSAVVIKKSHKGEEVITSSSGSSGGDNVITIAPPSAGTSVLDLLPGGPKTQDTTSQHNNHLYDQNCKICNKSSSLSTSASEVTNGGKNSSSDSHYSSTEQRSKKFDSSTKHSSNASSTKAHTNSIASDQQSNEQVDNQIGNEVDSSQGVKGSSSSPTTPVGSISSSSSSLSQPKRVRVEPDTAHKYLEEAAKFAKKSISTPGSTSSDSPVPAEVTTPKQQEVATRIWRGKIEMTETACFSAHAYPISGDLKFMRNNIPQTVQVCGRIAPEQVIDYIKQVKQNGNEVLLVRFTPSSHDQRSDYDYFFEYLNSRKRYAVADAHYKSVKDFYIVPLAGNSDISSVFKPFEGPGIEETGKRPNLLLGVIVRKLDSKSRKSHHGHHHSDRHGDSTSNRSLAGGSTPPSKPRSTTPPPIQSAPDSISTTPPRQAEDRSYTPPPVPIPGLGGTPPPISIPGLGGTPPTSIPGLGSSPSQ